MKKFSQFFGGKYMPYWYVAFGIVVIIMFAGFVNSSSVEKFKLTIFDNSGKKIEERILTRTELEKLNEPLPFSKAFEPIKKF
ncbi:MAG: hypothetical protein LDL10_06885 [Calditerrivibrio sp.]|nr:hypothetical protein [Calditerrivibrio sp.]